jgi:hypothetical protein
MRSDHHRLLAAAGFHATTEVDVTPAFAATAAAWLAETEPHAEDLALLEPPGVRAAASRPAHHAGRHPCRDAAPHPGTRPNKLMAKAGPKRPGIA